MSFWQKLFGRKSSRPTTPVGSSSSAPTTTSEAEATPQKYYTISPAQPATGSVYLLFVTGQRGQAPYGDLMQSVLSSLEDRGVEVKFLGASQVAGPLPESTDHEIIEIAMLACQTNDLPFSSLSVEYKLYTEGANTLGAITMRPRH